MNHLCCSFKWSRYFCLNSDVFFVQCERHTERRYTMLLIVHCLLSQQLNACYKYITWTITLFMMVTASHSSLLKLQVWCREKNSTSWELVNTAATFFRWKHSKDLTFNLGQCTKTVHYASCFRKSSMHCAAFAVFEHFMKVQEVLCFSWNFFSFHGLCQFVSCYRTHSAECRLQTQNIFFLVLLLSVMFFSPTFFLHESSIVSQTFYFLVNFSPQPQSHLSFLLWFCLVGGFSFVFSFVCLGVLCVGIFFK